MIIVTGGAHGIGLTRSLARELGEYQININAMAPGLTMSMDQVSEARMAQNQQHVQARVLKRTRCRRTWWGGWCFCAGRRATS